MKLTIIENAGLWGLKKFRILYLLLLAFGLSIIARHLNVLWQLPRQTAKGPLTQDGHDFEWLRNRNFLGNFMEPTKESALIVPRDIQASKDRERFACFLFSKPTGLLVRNAIRRTWGLFIKPIFILGLSEESVMESIRVEAETYNDILVENFIDSYLNLTLKTAFAMKNFLKYFASSKYFLKIDDDMFLNVKQLNSFLEKAPQNALFGNHFVGTVERRNETQYYVPDFLLIDTNYTEYLTGPCYLIPGHLVRKIYETAMIMPFFNMEDAFFIGMVAKRTLNYELHPDTRFAANACGNTCSCNKVIASLVKKPEDFLSLHQRLQNVTNC